MMYECAISPSFCLSVKKGLKSSSSLEVQSLLMAQILLKLSLSSRLPLKCSQILPNPSHLKQNCSKLVTELCRMFKFFSLQYLNFFRNRFLIDMKPSTSILCRIRVQADLMFSSTISSSHFECLQATSMDDSSSENSRNCLKSWKGFLVRLRRRVTRTRKMVASGFSSSHATASCLQY